MATYVENTAGIAADSEPVGLLTEGAAGIATIVLAIIALAGIATTSLAAIATIVIGVGLMVQGFNTAADNMRVPIAGGFGEFGAEVMVDCLGGGAGIVLGVLALLGVNAAALMPAALIVFGGALLLSGALAMRPRIGSAGSSATGGVELLLGVAAIVLGILSLVLTMSGVLLLVGFITLGAALLIVSATFGATLMRVFTVTTNE
jgi:hypothetical protein